MVMNQENDGSGLLRLQGEMRGSIVGVARRHATSPWTDDRIALVKTLWGQGASARRIARELGDDVSRSAVLGKIHRLGIVQTSPNSGARRSESKNARPAPRREHDVAGDPLGSQDGLPAWVRNAEPYIDNPLMDADVPISRRRALLELSSRVCRWPVGDPSRSGFFFCGADALPGKPYCGTHCARAYRPAEAARPEGASASGRARISRHRHFHQPRRNRWQSMHGV
jgi:GcrA cell cycle regulator